MAKNTDVRAMMESIPPGGHLRSKSGMVKIEPQADGSVRWTSGKVVTTVDAQLAAKRLAAYKDGALDGMVVVEPGDEVAPREISGSDHGPDRGPVEREATRPVPEVPRAEHAADGALPPGVRISKAGYVKIATNKPVMARWKSDEGPQLAASDDDAERVLEILGRVATTVEVRDTEEYELLRESAEASARLALEAGGARDRAEKSYAGAMQRIVEKLDATRHRLPAAATATA